MRKWVFPRQFSNGAQTSCTHTGRIKTGGTESRETVAEQRIVYEKTTTTTMGCRVGKRGKGGNERTSDGTAVLMNAPPLVYTTYIYVHVRTRACANITSLLHISNLISHMHNRKFPIPRTRMHAPPFVSPTSSRRDLVSISQSPNHGWIILTPRTAPSTTPHPFKLIPSAVAQKSISKVLGKRWNQFWTSVPHATTATHIYTLNLLYFLFISSCIRV